ncbi:MAG: hypothetical protein ABIH70_10400 [Chloroflexota bacterium]
MIRIENFLTSKIFRTTLILGVFLIVFELLTAMISHGFPRDMIYWVANAFQVTIAFFTYKTFKRAIIQMEHIEKVWSWSAWNRWLTLSLLLEIVGIGGPWVMYYSGIEVLRRASASWSFFLIAYFAFFIYLSFRYQRVR